MSKTVMGSAINRLYIKYGKRILDIILTIAALLIFGPVIGVIAVLNWFKLGRPIFFKQPRIGFRDTRFTITKFRTMSQEVMHDGDYLSDTSRLDQWGLMLRRFSLDELPELWNVLKGDMSLVGPRPLLVQYLDLYTPEQNRRHEVKPGVTGWAQINGRNSISWEQRFELDVWYVDHVSLFLDLKIIFLTVWKVLKREGISEQNRSTQTLFTGSDRSDTR